MNLYGIQLEIALVILAVATLMFDAFRVRPHDRILGCMLSAALVALCLGSFAMKPVTEPLFYGLFRLDAFALYVKRLLLLATAFVMVMATEHEPIRRGGAAESYALMLLAAVGMMLMASANDFILSFVAIELVTVSFYILTSYIRQRVSSLEAGLKYLVLGALAGSVTVYGVAYVFGCTGATRFDDVARAVGAGQGGAAYAFGMSLILLGLCFKIAAVPMQLWAPDVYQGAPTPVTAFLATGSKIAGFALLIRLYGMGLVPGGHAWILLVAILSGLTLVYGNFGALPQSDIKRIFAYSSIGQSGYMMMGLSTGTAWGRGAVLFYLTQYLFTVAAGFLAIVPASNATRSGDLRSYAGMHRRSPLLAGALFLSALSLAGVPPLSGAIAKFSLFAAVLRAAAGDHHYYVIAAVAALTVIVSLYFYFGIVRATWVEPAGSEAPVRVSRPIRLALVLALGGILILGVFQGPVLHAALAATAGLTAP